MKTMRCSIVCFIAVALLVILSAPGASAKDERPNVLLVIVDDMNDYGFGGLPLTTTPAIDRFRSTALTFKHAYCAAPVCGPSRASAFSGIYPHKTGSYLNGSDPWRNEPLASTESLPELFRRSGYKTFGAGKLFHAKTTTEKWDNAWDNKTPKGGFGPFPPEGDQIAGKFWGVTEWEGSDADFPDVNNADHTIAFLEQAHEKPFFLCFGLWRPHTPFTAPKRFFDLYDPTDIPVPPPGYASEDLADVPEAGRRLSDIWSQRWSVSGDAHADRWRRLLHGYLATTSFADWNVGRVFDALDRSPHADNTIVIFGSDNGYHMGEKNHYEKATLWEKSAYTPLAIRVPGSPHNGKTCTRPVGSIDLFPTIKKHSLSVFVPFCAVTLLLLATTARADKPNVIVIMADDIGAEGLACYGSTIYTTPHLDRMAEEGVRFRNAYATPLCTPTRVMIMSGLYPNRTGYRALIGKGEGVRLVPEVRTFAHDFRDAGYAIAVAGKWQLGKFDEYPEQPVEHGFDDYCMWTWVYKGKKSSRYYGPQIYRNGKVSNGDAEDFGPDDYRDFVLDFIDRKKDQPFLVYFPMALVHSPFINPPGLRKRAESNFTDDLDKQTRAFGHMITYMDQVVGDIMAKLKEHGLDKNTLVLFTGDNGTHKSITSKLPGMDLKGGKGSMTEAGSRVPLLAWWPGQIRPAGRDEFFCLVDVLPTIHSIAGIELNREVDGMDLSHLLVGGEGLNRERVLINYGRGFFVREKRFRLNQDGKLYDIPVTSDSSRYSETVTNDAAHNSDRIRLQQILDDFMAVEPQYNRGSTDSRKKNERTK